MNLEKISHVLDLTTEFAARAVEVEKEIDVSGLILGTKASGALRRTSMEQTRALAEPRRPG